MEELHDLAEAASPFREDPANARGRRLFDLSDGQWNVPGLRQLQMRGGQFWSES
jgi:hypothetical protein